MKFRLVVGGTTVVSNARNANEKCPNYGRDRLINFTNSSDQNVLTI